MRSEPVVPEQGYAVDDLVMGFAHLRMDLRREEDGRVDRLIVTPVASREWEYLVIREDVDELRTNDAPCATLFTTDSSTCEHNDCVKPCLHEEAMRVIRTFEHGMLHVQFEALVRPRLKTLRSGPLAAVSVSRVSGRGPDPVVAAVAVGEVAGGRGPGSRRSRHRGCRKACSRWASAHSAFAVDA